MENLLLPNSPSEMPEHSDSTSQLIREWLFRFGVEHKEDVAPKLPLWLEAFVGMDAETLESLFKKALKSCKFFPKISEILEPLQASEQADFEDEWQALLDYCREWVHPDIRFSGVPSLPVEIDHAARAAGGVHFLKGCSSEELGWRKKAFIEDLTRSRKTGDLAGLLTGGELRKFLRQAAVPAALLPDSIPYTPAIAVERDSMQSAGEIFAKLDAAIRETPRVIDFEGRSDELARQAELIKQMYPATGKEAAP
jgi:hypothetical protein